MRVGDKVNHEFVWEDARITKHNWSRYKPMRMVGTVIFIHPRGRFYTAEFTFPNGAKFRESFLLQREGHQ